MPRADATGKLVRHNGQDFQKLFVVRSDLWWKLVLSYHGCLAPQVDFDDPIHEVSVGNSFFLRPVQTRPDNPNPGGSPVHYGVVHYGTDPHGLTETAKSPIRLNPEHASTVFRVRLDNLKARTTYYFRVDSMQANGGGDGVTSPLRQFSTL